MSKSKDCFCRRRMLYAVCAFCCRLPVVCKNYSSKKNSLFPESGTPTGSPECTLYCKHCVGCTIRYTDASVKGDNKVIQRFVKCKCGHNNIFNVWRRIKYILLGRRVILKVITNDGIKQIN